jgi:hypothetical protein
LLEFMPRIASFVIAAPLIVMAGPDPVFQRRIAVLPSRRAH